LGEARSCRPVPPVVPRRHHPERLPHYTLHPSRVTLAAPGGSICLGLMAVLPTPRERLDWRGLETAHGGFAGALAAAVREQPTSDAKAEYPRMAGVVDWR